MCFQLDTDGHAHTIVCRLAQLRDDIPYSIHAIINNHALTRTTPTRSACHQSRQHFSLLMLLRLSTNSISIYRSSTSLSEAEIEEPTSTTSITTSSGGRLWRWATHHPHHHMSSSHVIMTTSTLYRLHHVYTNRARSSFIGEYFDRSLSTASSMYGVLLEQSQLGSQRSLKSHSLTELRVAPSHSTAQNSCK